MNKSRELAMLEESLRDFIIETYVNDEREKETFNAFKYRGLTIIIDNITKGSIPTFTVQVAMLSAEFSIDAGKKINGGLGSMDERMIEQWLERGPNRQLLRIVWDGKTDDKFVKIKPFDMY